MDLSRLLARLLERTKINLEVHLSGEREWYYQLSSNDVVYPNMYCSMQWRAGQPAPRGLIARQLVVRYSFVPPSLETIWSVLRQELSYALDALLRPPLDLREVCETYETESGAWTNIPGLPRKEWTWREWETFHVENYNRHLCSSPITQRQACDLDKHTCGK